MDALEKWKDNHSLHFSKKYNYITSRDLLEIGRTVYQWWHKNGENAIETNNRLIAIIQWVNGEDVFEVEEPHKFVVRTVDTDLEDEFWYISTTNSVYRIDTTRHDGWAAKFDTPEEAQKYCVPGYEVVEIDADGNEVK